MQIIAPIFCRVNGVKLALQEAGHWYRGKLTINPQTLCG